MTRPRPDSRRSQDSVLWRLVHRHTLAAVITTLLWLGSQGLRPFVPLRLDQLGASEAEIGVAVSAYALLGFVLALPAGRLVDRVSPVGIVIVSLLAQAGLAGGYAVATGVGIFVLLQVGTGLTFMTAWLGLQSLVMRDDGVSLRFHLAVFSFGWGLGQAAGPSLGGLVFEQLGFSVLASGVLATYLAATALAFGYGRAHRQATSETAERASGTGRRMRDDLRTLGRNRSVRLVMVAAYTSIAVEAVKTSFYPLYLEREGVSVASIGLLLSISAGLAVLIRAVLPVLRRRRSAGWLLVVSTSLGILGMALTPVLTGSIALLIAAAALMGVSAGLNPPITIELTATDTVSGERGLATALRAMSNRLANLSQPVVFSAIASGIGLGAAFPAVGLALAGMTCWMGRLASAAREGDPRAARDVHRDVQ